MKKIAKSMLMLMMISFLLFVGGWKTVSAYGTYEYGNLYYTLTNNGKNVVITGCKNGTTKITIPEQIDDMDVVEIRSFAFKNDENLVSVTTESVESIGDQAFYDCENLTEINAPNATKINWNTFSYCNQLKNVIIAQKQNKRQGYIDSGAFYGCNSLEDIDTGCIERIGERAFSDCMSLKNVKIPTASIVAVSAFEDCEKLSDVDMPNVEDVSESAFKSCSLLQNVQMSNVKYIGNEAFYNCKSLNHVIMSKVSQIGDDAFVNTNLTKVCFSDDISSIGYHALGYDHQQDKYDRDVWTKKEGFTIHCSKPGNTYAYAKDHGFNYEEHTLKVKSEIKASCTRDGKKIETCLICGFEKTTITKKYGHSYNAGVIITKPTNTKNGVKKYTCKRCEATKTTTIKAYKTQATETYKNYLKNRWNCKYKIIDVDKNGIPELLIKDNDNYKVIAYTYNSKFNKMVKIKSLSYGKGGMLKYNTKSHYLSFVTADTGGFKEYIYKLSGFKLKAIRTITYNNGKFGKKGYKIKKKTISATKYKKYLKGFKTIK